MKSLIITNNNLPTYKEIKEASTDELKKALTQSLVMTAKYLEFMANIWYELEKRGEDLRKLKSEMTDYLGYIARGKLSSEAAIQFAGHKVILNNLLKLELSEQNRLAHGGTLKVVEIYSDGDYEVFDKPLTEIKYEQIKVIFNHYGLRSIEEQIQVLEKNMSLKQYEKTQMRIDSNGCLKIGHSYLNNGGKRVTIKELLPVIGAYYKIDLEDLLRRREEQTD